MELSEVADELYALTPEEFTRTRNERAKEAKAEDKDLSNTIKALVKPSTAAWVVNMLARNQPDVVSQVVELGDALRDAQENLEGDALRQLTKQRRQLTAAVTNQARGLAHDLGVRVSQAVADQVEETLRAAMTDEGAAKAVRSGQLLEALAATGLGDLDVSDAVAVPEAIGMTARPVERKQPKLTVVEEPEREPAAKHPEHPEQAEEQAEDAEKAEEQARQRALEGARRTVEEADAAAAKAQKKLDKTKKRAAKLEARSLQLQGELEELRRRASYLEHELETVDEELSDAEDKRERAEEKQAEARTAADEARSALTELEQP
jgi:hypothetical protein